jgi:hypothetical protein
MAQLMNAADARLTFGEIALGISPDTLEQYKLGRLAELRALIDSLRAQHYHDLLRHAVGEQDQAIR